MRSMRSMRSMPIWLITPAAGFSWLSAVISQTLKHVWRNLMKLINVVFVNYFYFLLSLSIIIVLKILMNQIKVNLYIFLESFLPVLTIISRSASLGGKPSTIWSRIRLNISPFLLNTESYWFSAQHFVKTYILSLRVFKRCLRCLRCFEVYVHSFYSYS